MGRPGALIRCRFSPTQHPPQKMQRRYVRSMGTFVGFDPGGAGAFGWAVLVGEELRSHTASRIYRKCGGSTGFVRRIRAKTRAPPAATKTPPTQTKSVGMTVFLSAKLRLRDQSEASQAEMTRHSDSGGRPSCFRRGRPHRKPA